MWDGVEHMKTSDRLFNGFYLGEVIEVEEGGTGRARVRVFPMMTGLNASVLPWAIPAFPLFEGAAENQGAYLVPAENSRVWIFFVGGCVRSPVYFANAPGKTEMPTGASATRKVLQTRTGHKIEIEDESGEEFIKITHKDGSTSVELDKDGKILVNAGGDIELTAGGDVNVTAGGDVGVTATGGDINVTAAGGSEVQLGAGGLVKTLLNEAAATLFNSHTHTETGGTTLTPLQQMGPTHLTSETKAS